MSHCQHILETIEGKNLFLVSVDEERKFFRYHHLFAQLLQGLLMKGKK